MCIRDSTYTSTGPEFPSVVPDYTTVWVIGRFETTEEMLRSLARVDKCAQAGALATETTVEEEVITITHHKIPNKVLAEKFYRNLQTIGCLLYTSRCV